MATGLKAPPSFSERAGAEQQIARITGLPFVAPSNKFTVQGSHDSTVMATGLLRLLVVSLSKIANDVRLLTS